MIRHNNALVVAICAFLAASVLGSQGSLRRGDASMPHPWRGGISNATLWEAHLTEVASSIRYLVAPGLHADDSCGSIAVMVVSGSGISGYDNNGTRKYTIRFPRSIDQYPFRPVISKSALIQIIPYYGLMAWSCVDGTALWLHEDGGVASNVEVASPRGWACFGTAYFNTGKGTVNCLRAADGKFAWGSGACATCTAIPSVLTAPMGVVYFEVDSTGAGTVVGRGFDNKEQFRTSAPTTYNIAHIRGGYSGDADVAVFSSGDAPLGYTPWIAGFQCSTGTMLWSSNATLTGFIVDTGTAVGTNGVLGTYLALRASRGTVLWANLGCMGVQAPPPASKCSIAAISTTCTDLSQVATSTGSVVVATQFFPLLVVHVAVGTTAAYATLQRDYNTPARLVAVAGAWNC